MWQLKRSLGCTIIELLTGKPPYWDAGAMSALFKMVSCEHPPLPEGISDVIGPICAPLLLILTPCVCVMHYDQELRDFLLKCFTRDTTKRPCPSELQKHPWIANNVPSVRHCVLHIYFYWQTFSIYLLPDSLNRAKAKYFGYE